MKHITEYCKTPVNDLSLTDEEYRQLKAFLEPLGVELRMVSHFGHEGVYQARNAYKTELAYRDPEAYDKVEQDIKKGWWRR